ncbi:hypothetical protein Mmc1_1070 [Magnetococcus marinus MC-1]|uniref:Uncharacterized protein n=1 Tax=Magnetococcus marinus (strain ATCC BAA-1437 / JCM 17883 / MC-1) TaxID=156889 RepID=A0L6J5_MAGMM|nr:hypothetical protein Mmc1_1070 [Magnetococcus marinus MC-1]
MLSPHLFSNLTPQLEGTLKTACLGSPSGPWVQPVASRFTTGQMRPGSVLTGGYFRPQPLRRPATQQVKPSSYRTIPTPPQPAPTRNTFLHHVTERPLINRLIHLKNINA